ncbi:DNA-directed RNA polymerase subunit alpha, partial [bacterium]|nr:DNA-directed RNA polymerase subunit alpha [bacterium]
MQFEPSQKPKQILCDNESLSNTYGKFIAEPFERGFGHTIGNSLRRILLSSISGAAIVAVKIEGIEHEFSTVSGITEDVSDIIFNLKKIVLTMFTEEPKYLRLNVKKKGDIKAADIETDADVQILNPDVHIATLGAKGELSMELLVLRGYGYIPSERNDFIKDLPIGWIPIDAVFSPVRKINYKVDETRIGQITDYDCLTIEIWTNGSIHPKDALIESSKILKDHLEIFIKYEEGPIEELEIKEESSEKLLEILAKSIDELELSVRSHNCLKNANILTIADLVQRTDMEMLRTRNFGRKSLNEIKEVLHEMNLSFGMNLDNFPQFKKEIV